MEFLKGMQDIIGFAVPGMATPTLDMAELGKRIASLQAVESWLRMSLPMLQSIQGLEIQWAALATMQAIN